MHSSWAALDNFVFNWLDFNAGRPSRRYYTEQPESSNPVVDTDLPRRAQSLPIMSQYHQKQGDALAPATPTSIGGSGRGRRGSAASGSMPPPASIPSRVSGSRASSVSRGLVELPNYRRDHLHDNGIRWEPYWDNVPNGTRQLAESMYAQRSSPEPSQREILASQDFQELRNGCNEKAVEEYVKSNVIFDRNRHAKLQRCGDVLIHNSWVPSLPGDDRVSQPKPDGLYGYDRNSSFGEAHKLEIKSMRQRLESNNEGLTLPFLVIEYKGEGPASNGNLWVAENQCFGASSACINMASHLNAMLSDMAHYPGPVKRLDETVFSIAMSNRSATLFVSWQDSHFFTAEVESFSVRKPKDLIEFRRIVRNIIDWGMDTRLQQVYNCLDALMEERRLCASHEAKNRNRSE